MKKIGILGGISHPTTIEYYQRIMDLYFQRNGNINYPEIVIYSLSHGQFKGYEDSNQIDKYIDYISFGVENLIKAGAEVIALAANSPHRVIDDLKSRFNIPFVNALDSAFNAARKQNIKKGLLLGIKFTMQSTFYQKHFEKGGIELIVPTDSEQSLINEIILNSLSQGIIIDPKITQQITAVIANYEADGVVLGCMRLPVIYNEQNAPGINIVNTLEKHIEDILNCAEN